MNDQPTDDTFDESYSDVTDEAADEPSRSAWFRPLLIAGVAVLLLVAGWFGLRTTAAEAETLGEVLAKLNDVQTLHLQLVQDSKTQDVWVKNGTRLRRDLTPREYQVDDGKVLWTVCREENRVTRAPSAYFRPQSLGLDLLSLIDVTHPQVQINLLASRPVERIAQADAVSYRFLVPAGVGHPSMEVEAVVQASDQMPRSLRLKTVQASGVARIRLLQVAAVNDPLGDEMFAIADTLTEDGRIGKVTDSQGLVSLRPVTCSRWTPSRANTVLKPRDWLRTDLRGAHAAAVQLTNGTQLTLGPGTLIEFETPTRVRLLTGEIQVTADSNQSVTLVGPDDKPVEFAGRKWYRVVDEKLTELSAAPAWLAGFEGASTREAVGSLVARIDGRDTPLSIGDHRVTVDIRDQIARTVIEESFVNHTATQLEGVFHFPLPADASISGFGMWIGDNYVEADVVEKQRAREIFESILREKRDPGLLEWTGGNVFTARVFPIPANGSKRIRISYTQVLPLSGKQYRYNYPLQSDMLRAHPLKTLDIQVKIHSAMPMQSVICPTHSARIVATEYSAETLFSRQEYTPERDFEVIVELAREQTELALIPHQRGEDGYFMLQVQPVALAATTDRDVLPDGQPVKLLVLADTSRSMDRSSRAAQDAFVSSLLSSLAPTDSFNLATCDVECQWAFDKPVPAEPANIETAREKLSTRVSLGWSDLEKALDSAFQQSDATTQIVYVGDGIVTTGAVEPAEFAQRIGQRHAQAAGVVHAVAVSSRYEEAALKAMASLGSGSFRRITGDTSPAAAARELLADLVQPAAQIAKLEFPGLLTARVYPTELPPLTTGAQQILLGRYLPPKDKKPSEAIVTLQRGDKVWALKTPISLTRAAEGNEFIPRLWARHHLDALLQQGDSPIIRDEIIALSEEFHIMTPYTSLLVLETDADRERFGVKKRFLMRDGERFFAEGRDQANLDLRQQQMRAAGDWRIRQRMRVLREFSTLGRRSEVYSDFVSPSNQWARLTPWACGGWFEVNFGDRFSMSGTASHPFGIGGTGGLGGMAGGAYFGGPFQPLLRGSGDARTKFTEFDSPLVTSVVPVVQEPLGDPFGTDWDFDGEWDVSNKRGFFDSSMSRYAMYEEATEYAGDSEADRLMIEAMGYNDRRILGQTAQMKSISLTAEGDESAPRRALFGPVLADAASIQSRTQALCEVVPNYDLIPTPRPVGELLSLWPDDVREVMSRVLVEVPLPSGSNKFAFRSTYSSPDEEISSKDVGTEKLLPRFSMTALAAAGKWLAIVDSKSNDVRVDVCDGPERAWFSRAFLCGHARSAVELERSTWPLARNPLDVHDLSDYEAEIIESHDSITVVRLTDRRGSKVAFQIEVDRQRDVLLTVKEFGAGELFKTTTYGDFVQVEGAWWPKQIQARRESGGVDYQINRELVQLDDASWNARWQSELSARDKSLMMTTPLPFTRAARTAIDQGKATWQDQFALLLDAYRMQQWDLALAHLNGMEFLVPDKPGFMWIRHGVWRAARRHEDLRERLVKEAGELVASLKEQDPYIAYCQAIRLQQDSDEVMDAQGKLSLLATLEPVFQAALPANEAKKFVLDDRIDLLQEADDREGSMRLLNELASEDTEDDWARSRYVDALIEERDVETAVELLKQWAAPQPGQENGTEDDARRQLADVYRDQERYPELVEHLANWVAMNPVGWNAYEQYLSALVKTNQSERAEQLVGQWLSDGCQANFNTLLVSERLESAIDFACGNGFPVDTQTYDPQWNEPLAALVRFYVEQTQLPECLDRFMAGDSEGFAETDVASQLRKELLQRLLDQAGSLAIGHLEKLTEWTSGEQTAEQRLALIAALRNRWDKETRPDLKYRLGEVLVELLVQCGDEESLLAFLRTRVETSTRASRPDHEEQLFKRLLEVKWSVEREQEAFRLLRQMTSSYGPATTLRSQSERLQNLCDNMVQKRAWALMCQDADAASMSALETLDVAKANEPKARLAMAERLSGEIANSPEPFALWLTAEWIYWQMLTGQNLDQVEKRCWEVLGSEPPYIASEDAVMDELREIPLQRALAALLNLASRRTARDESVKRLLAYIDRGIQKGDVTSAGWRQVKGDLLLALDRSDELVACLRAWIAVGDADADLWRITLGHVLAEQGNLPEAISLLADLQQLHRLEAEDLWALSDWYLAEGQREKHTQARVESLAFRDEWKLEDALNRRISTWRPQRAEAVDARDPFGDPLVDSPLSGSTEEGRTQVEDMDLQLFAALFIKSSSPETYLHQLQQAYGATRDFRLLNGLADAVMGQSAEKVYECLQNTGAVIAEVQEEATVDALTTHINEVRSRAVTHVDRRALDMLEVLIERRAAELQNQPGPHVARALEALQRAAKGEWSPGEPPQMAGLLASLGRIPDQTLADEQLRQLQTLQDVSAPGSDDRLKISVNLAAVYWGYQRSADATDLLQAVINECQQTHGDSLPVCAQDAVVTYWQYLTEQGQFARAEDELRRLAEHPIHTGQGYWFDEQLDRVYGQSLAHGGEVSLGKGKDLFVPLTQRLKNKLQHPDLEHRRAALERLLSVYSTAKGLAIESTASDLIAFSREPLYSALQLRLGEYHDVVRSVASTMEDVAGKRELLAFLIWSLEHEPHWLADSRENGWRSHADSMAYARADLADLGDLERPLLAIVLRELRRDLLDREFRIEDFYKIYQEHFWNEKRDDFLQTAQAVFAESRSAPDTQRFVAQFVAEGLEYYDTGIEMLLSQYQEGTLDYEWRVKLASWLNRSERFDESIPILQRLIEERPDDVDVACPLMHALSMTDRQDECRLVVQHVEASVRETSRGRLGALERPLAGLAEASWMSRLFDVAARLYAEVIALHKQVEPQRGSGDGVLSNYCANLAESLAALGRTAEAIDAACEAVVSWGPSQRERLATMATLQQVLRKTTDLPGYIAQLDRETQQAGQDKPIVRIALGVVLSERREWAAAIEQFKKAALLQPNDSDVWEKLTRCYDATGNKQAAVDALLNQLELQPREIEVCRDLAQRYDELGETAEAERALTTIVELLPQEAESHTMLAEIRQGQGRWADAAVHWQRVAKLRELEPTGLINLAAIQIRLEQWQAARETLQQIKSRQWPARFDSVSEDVERLERELEGRE